MTDKITILVATMSGNAEMLAEVMSDAIEDDGGAARIVRMEKVRLESLAAGGTFIICSSTYGKGDVPDNGKGLYQTLQEQRPALDAVRYGAVSLGNSVYPATFAFGGKKFDELFAELGAHKIGERLILDARASTDPEEAVLAWLKNWRALLSQSTPTNVQF